MKKVLLISFLLFVSVSLFSQAPGYFNYQAVIKDGSGELIKNQDVKFRITIIPGSISGTGIYTETHEVTSNDAGVCNLEIGGGSDPTSDFELINWAIDNYFLKVDLDESGGTEYSHLGTVQLLSVPYSLYSNTASKAKYLDNPVFYLSDVESVSDTLFAVRDRDGNIVFAVYPDGVMVYVNEAAKGKIGGFAVSGRNPAKATEEDYFVVTADSTRVYVNQPLKKGKIGGFAVSGRNPAKAIEEDYLVVTADSTRIYVNQQTDKGKIGGFAVSGRNPAKAEVDNFLNITPENYFIGHGSGTNNTTGLYNSFLGFESGLSNTAGSQNVFVGYLSGKNNTEGDYNTFIGDQTGVENTIGYKNVFLGTFSGANNSEGFANVFLGCTAGPYNTTGNRNIFIGQASGWNNDTANYNIFIGNQSGVSNQGGEFNVFLGTNSGHENYVGDYNVYIGEQTGYANIFGSDNTYLGHNAGNQGDNGNNNVFLGSHSGYLNAGDNNVFIGKDAGYNELGSNKLYISNSSTSDPLIKGDFSTGKTTLNNILNLNGVAEYPASPTEGDIIRLNEHTSDPNGVYIYTGSAWQAISTW